MKTASMLFGLVLTTAGVAHASPRTDANGDVACGNVMSKSADDTCTVRTATTAPRAVAKPAKPTAAKLVFPRAPIVHAIVLSPAARPIADANGDMACGNVMTKGGRKHTCHAITAAASPPATTSGEDPVLAAFYAPPAK
jgi:hypothetical protein